VGAASARADVVGALYAVFRTGVVVVGEDAACCRVAGVTGADVVVVTYKGCSRLTCSSGAGIACGTGVAVGARSSIIGMYTPCSRIAAVISTDVPIIAVGRCSTYASSAGAGIGCSTGVAVVA